MEQTKALNALEPFLALSNSANSPRAAADLITQATSAPNTYAFAELLQTPNIQALRQSPDRSQYLNLLEIFSWGTWHDYNANEHSLPALNDAQTTKLRLLSLLRILPSSHPNASSYEYLQTALALPSPRDLEALIQIALSSSLINAKLSPITQTVSVSSVAPLRDLAPGSIPAMLDTLTEWEARCTGVLGEIDAQIAQAKARAREKNRRERRLEEVWMTELEKEGKGKGEDGGTDVRGNAKRDGAEAMDIDDEEQENQGGSVAGKHGKKDKGGKGYGMFAGLARKLGTG